MRFIKNFVLLLAIIAFTSCEGIESDPIPLREEFEDWILLKIPNGREAHAISGSIDDVLVVTTETKVYSTQDAGKSWTEVADFQGPMPGLLERNDTLFIFAGLGQGADYDIASNFMRFSTNKGLTWHKDKDKFYDDLVIPIKYVETKFDISYKIKKNYVTINGGTSSYIGPSDIEKTIDKHTNILETPFEYILNNLHMDDKNRLYVAASFGTVKDNGKVSPNDRSSPALVFISKNPLP